MADTLICSCADGLTRVGAFARDELVEAAFHDARYLHKGSLCRVKITASVPVSEAFFVRLPRGETGFLPFERGPGPAPTVGQTLWTEVVREARQDKDAKLSTRLHLASPFLIATPQRPEITLSAKIGADERKRLEALGKDLLAARPSLGFIFRTAAQGLSSKALTELAGELAGKAELLQAPETTFIPPPEPVFDMIAFYAGTLKRIVMHGNYNDFGAILINFLFFACHFLSI